MRMFIGFIAVVPILFGSVYFFKADNFHPVIPGEVYRSAQLSTNSLEQYALEYDLRSVLNLRGARPDEDWYQAEKAVIRLLGIALFDIELKAYRLPNILTLRKLLEILDQIPKPYLVHCEGGADRSGLVSTILLLNEGVQSLSEIEKHVSWRYLATSDDSVGKLFFEEYRAWLDANGLRHNPSRFSDWLQNEYRDNNGNFGFHIDGINGVLAILDQQRGLVFNIPRTASASLSIHGWAVDHGNESLISSIEILINRKPAHSVRYGFSRPDVGNYFDNPGFDKSGWRSKFDQESLASGCHPMQLRITRLDGTVWQSSSVASLCIDEHAES